VVVRFLSGTEFIRVFVMSRQASMESTGRSACYCTNQRGRTESVVFAKKYAVCPMTDTKQAEKEYLTRTGSSEWERVKPFSQRGADTLLDSARLLHDFAMAMLSLQPAPDDLILDLGAGGCWCSDLLARLNRRSVAVDISLDMLRTGRSRPNGAFIRAVAGDMEQLPFRDGSFARAVCLSAIHHVPDVPGAVREIARVLNSNGMALFSEPGAGHAESPVSTVAMRDFGVLEQDILIPRFVAACYDAGFRDVRIKPIAYAIPEFDLTPDDWQNWSRLADSRRPMRALRKIGRGIAELVGAGKKTMLFEEAFGMSLVRMLRHAMEDHPIIVALKGEAGRGKQVSWRARIDIVQTPQRATPGELLHLRIRLTNTGSATWHPSSAHGTGHVTLGVQVVSANGRLMARDHHRATLPRPIRPREGVTLEFDCPAPSVRGACQLKFDLVAEGVMWFEATGSPAAICPLTVE
jgi:SAM-dependent methyltransferase